MKTRWEVLPGGLVCAGLLIASISSQSEAATLCVNPTGTGGCSSSIQGGVDLAGPGDTVTVSSGVYFENVRVPANKEGLQIVGAGKTATILDAGNYAPLGITTHSLGIVIFSRFVTVKNLTIRNGGGGIEAAPGARGVLLQGLNVTGPDSTGIFILDWNAQIIQSEVHDTATGIADMGGFGTVIKNTTVTNCTSAGAVVQSDQAQVTGSHFVNTAIGIQITGDGAVVNSNDVRHEVEGIFVTGNAPTIQANKVLGFGTGFGILAQCSPNCFGGSVAGNTVTDGLTFGIIVVSDSPGLSVQKNTVARVGAGINLNTAASSGGITATSNKVIDAGIVGSDDCYEAFGSNVTLSLNTAANCARAGFYLSGSDAIVSGNRSTNAAENGFTVDGSAGENQLDLLSGNVATGAAGQGFAVINGAVLTTLTSNTASRNRVGFCDAGSLTILTGATNNFGTPATGTCDISHP